MPQANQGQDRRVDCHGPQCVGSNVNGGIDNDGMQAETRRVGDARTRSPSNTSRAERYSSKQLQAMTDRMEATLSGYISPVPMTLVQSQRT